MHTRILALVPFLGLALVGCKTAQVRVMPGEDGVNQVIVRDIGRDGAEEAAVDAANDYCKDRNQEAVFLKDKNQTKYTGSMDEQTRDTVRKASTVAMMVGGVGYGARESVPAAVLGTAGTAGMVMTNGRDYENSLESKCR
jgi:hypothetical protein